MKIIIKVVTAFLFLVWGVQMIDGLWVNQFFDGNINVLLYNSGSFIKDVRLEVRLGPRTAAIFERAEPYKCLGFDPNFHRTLIKAEHSTRRHWNEFAFKLEQTSLTIKFKPKKSFNLNVTTCHKQRAFISTGETLHTNSGKLFYS